MARNPFDEFRNGGEEGFNRVYHKFYGYTQRFLYFEMGHWHDSEDANQALWTKVSEKRHTFRGNTWGELFYWLKKSAYRLLLEKGMRPTLARLSDAEMGRELKPEDRATAREMAERIVLGLSFLSPGDRDILILTFDQELSRYEVAALLGTTKNDAAVRLHRALVRYGRILSSLCTDIRAQGTPRAVGEMLKAAIDTLRTARH